MTEPKADLRLVDLTKTFGQLRAVDDLSLAIASGEFISLLGPSGCGKSTLLRMIAGFERPTNGDIYIRDQKVTSVQAHRRNIGMVFQNYALFPHMRISANIEFGLKAKRFPRHERADRVADVLRTVRLDGFGQRFPNQLSGGQQQRVALARALAIEPAVLLLDEPLAALDKKLREEMQIELRDLHNRFNMTTIFVTHDQEEALTLSDRVVVMNAGLIEQIGSPREMYERPKTEFVATFMGINNILNGRVASKSGGEALVDLDLGFAAPVAGTLEPGTRVRAALRPERIKLVPSGSDGVTGEITNVVYLGYNAHVRIRCRDETLTVFVPNDRGGATALQPGQTVTLAWNPDDLVLLETPKC